MWKSPGFDFQYLKKKKVQWKCIYKKKERQVWHRSLIPALKNYIGGTSVADYEVFAVTGPQAPSTASAPSPVLLAAGLWQLSCCVWIFHKGAWHACLHAGMSTCTDTLAPAAAPPWQPHIHNLIPGLNYSVSERHPDSWDHTQWELPCCTQRSLVKQLLCLQSVLCLQGPAPRGNVLNEVLGTWETLITALVWGEPGN